MAATFMATTSRIIGGLAANPQNLFSISNGDSIVVINVRRVTVELDASTALIAVTPQIKGFRATSISGGSNLTKNKIYPNSTNSNSNVKLLGANSTDAGAASAISATPGTLHYQRFANRMQSAVGQVLPSWDCHVLPPVIGDTSMPSFKLKQNEGFIVSVASAATSSNPAGSHWIVNCVWEEV